MLVPFAGVSRVPILDSDLEFFFLCKSTFHLYSVVYSKLYTASFCYLVVSTIDVVLLQEIEHVLHQISDTTVGDGFSVGVWIFRIECLYYRLSFNQSFF